MSMPPLPGGDPQLVDSVEQEIETEDGKWYIRRILPYRNFEGRPQGLVLTFVDVTDLKRAGVLGRQGGADSPWRLMPAAWGHGN